MYGIVGVFESSAEQNIVFTMFFDDVEGILTLGVPPTDPSGEPNTR